MLKFLRWPLRIIAAIFIIFILYVNVRLYDVPTCDPAPSSYVNVDALRQLHFLRRMLREENAGEEMQLLYPEGYVFIYALYALTWCDLVERLPPESMHWQEGIREIAFSLNALDAPAGKRVFNPDLPLTYGAFYRGWTAYVRGRYLQLRPASERDTSVMRQFQGECIAIAAAIGQTEKPYLESYRDMAWPADNIVCLAALALHDRIGVPRFQEVTSDWLQRIKSTLVPEYGLIPHGYGLDGNRPLEGVRGSSQSLMLCFLMDIDPVFAKEQYQHFRKHFLVYRLGLPGIREYPKGEMGFGDIDSGPVLAGIGGAASIVGIRAALQYGDREMATALRSGVNALLLPQSSKEEKYYLFGQLPMLDAFMAWSDADICAASSATTGNWRWKCQVISLLLIAVVVFLLRRVEMVGKG